MYIYFFIYLYMYVYIYIYSYLETYIRMQTHTSSPPYAQARASAVQIFSTYPHQIDPISFKTPYG